MQKKNLYTYPHTGDHARSFEVDSAAPWQRAPPLDHVQVAACSLARVVTAAAATTRRRRHSMIVLLYGYPNITLSGM